MKYKLIKAASMERKVNQKAPMKYKSTKQHQWDLKSTTTNK
jgi:hypothetical protein